MASTTASITGAAAPTRSLREAVHPLGHAAIQLARAPASFALVTLVVSVRVGSDENGSAIVASTIVGAGGTKGASAKVSRPCGESPGGLGGAPGRPAAFCSSSERAPRTEYSASVVADGECTLGGLDSRGGA